MAGVVAVLLTCTVSPVAWADPRPAPPLKEGDECGAGVRVCGPALVCKVGNYAVSICTSEKKVRDEAKRKLGQDAQTILGRMPEWTPVWIANNYEPTDVQGSLTSSQTIAKAIAELRTIIAKLRALEPSRTEVVDEIGRQVDGFEKDFLGALSSEEKCRSTPACVGARIAINFCNDVHDRKVALQEIATEKANPGGVVDLRRLHSLGERIQADDAAIANERAAYLKSVKRPLTEAACVKPTLDASDPTLH